MVLTDDEKSALTELLSGVEAEDLMQIAKTVSQKLLNIKSVNDALEVILLHSETAESVLHRKKISKQLLYNYLHYKQIPVPSHLSKHEIIQQLLQYWRGNLNQSIEAPPRTPNDRTPSTIQDVYNQSQPTYSQQMQPLYNQQSQGTYNQHASQQPALQSYNSQASEWQNSIVPQSQEIGPPPGNCLDILSNINIQELGYEFTKWFHEKFNACTRENGFHFDSNMFFTNASAQFKIIHSTSGGDENSVQLESSEQISASIVQLQRTYEIFLLPNTESLRVEKNTYGNVILGVRGSLHSQSQVRGVYDLLIQLFHDPLCQLSDKPVWRVQKALLQLKFADQSAVECSSQQECSNRQVEYLSEESRHLTQSSQHRQDRSEPLEIEYDSNSFR
ncbi:hypothetical protein M8J76_005706 [Diaphorina citri]|nr:hypothetical protein M8J76_005706 [Diaphorina citri]